MFHQIHISAGIYNDVSHDIMYHLRKVLKSFGKFRRVLQSFRRDLESFGEFYRVLESFKVFQSFFEEFSEF